MAKSGCGREVVPPSASELATRIAVTQGSFKEAKDTLALLGCGSISVSELRKETLRVGEIALAGLRTPEKDVRMCPDAKLRTPDGARMVPRTLVLMADGTNPPCMKADTSGVRGEELRAGEVAAAQGDMRMRIRQRHGQGRRIRRLYQKELESSRDAGDALNYLDKRRGNMRYGWLRRNGYYISSCHVEAAARIIVARRCKQAGMHWRHHNAACVCAIVARLRSAA